MNKAMTKERIAFVDYIRVIACLLVMVVHASEQFYNMGPVSQVATEDNRLWVSVYDGFFGRDWLNLCQKSLCLENIA
jgi:peptidoglycan/LPS O-acetylase OafA/YrhL